jgi:predicted hydrocarbon binding protein
MRDKFPLDLLRSISISERKLSGFSIIAKNVPGILANVGKICADRMINIVSIITSAEQIVGSDTHVFLIADLTDSTTSPEALREELSKINNIISVDIVEPFANFIIDNTHFPLTLYGGKTRAIIIGESVIKGFLFGLSQQLGEPISQITLWNMGYGAGKEIWNLIYEWRKAAVKELVELMLKTSIALGWFSKYEIVDYSPVSKYVKIRIWDNWECHARGISGRPESHFLRGIFAGFFTKHFNENCQAFETKCISKGDEFCEFEIKVKES